MNRSTIIIVAFGFFFALLAAVAVQMVGGRGKNAPVASGESKTIAVLVAARDIKAGETLGPGATQWAVWPETAKFAGSVVQEGGKKPEEAMKGRVRRAFSKGEPLSTAALIEDTKSNFVTASLTKGMRAVTITVNAQSSVGGFAMPGDHVDIILTYDVKLPGDEKIRKAAMPVVTKLAAETILENLKVLAVDQSADKKTEAKVGKTVTLEVAPHQAEALTLAGKMGTLSLSLRPLGDEDPIATISDGKPVPMTTDLRLSGVMREIMKGENKSGSVTQVVRVYSGTRVDNVEVRPYVSQ